MFDLEDSLYLNSNNGAPKEEIGFKNWNLYTKKRKYRKIGRNDTCPCGSGRKYKKCCLDSGKFEEYEKGDILKD
jgi:uncharacterized protein YchJ